jgi:Alpha-L-arabinofuranosidase C-terminal domain
MSGVVARRWEPPSLCEVKVCITLSRRSGGAETRPNVVGAIVALGYQMNISARNLKSGRTAPRRIEDEYNITDAVVFGNLLISLLRHSDRVAAACLAQPMS